MNQTPVENEQSISTRKIQAISLELGERLPDTLGIYLEPGRPISPDETPACVIMMGNDDIVDRSEKVTETEIKIANDGTWQNAA